jgi:exosortase C (VPDSG-CTERM-specific)
MKEPGTKTGQEPPAKMSGWPIGPNSPFKGFALAVGGLLLCFSWPLYDLVRFSLGNELYSHIVLIPFISLYLFWLKCSNANISLPSDQSHGRDARATWHGRLAHVWENQKAKICCYNLPLRSAPNRPLAVLLLAGGVAALAGRGIAALSDPPLARVDSLALLTLSFVLLFGGICGLFLGRKILRALAFPLGFLVFMVPIPTFLLVWIETFLQHGSASVAGALFKLSGTPLFREDLVFQLPGISLQIAPECSGIHSSLALFITSILAGYFFLRSPVSRAVLALAVIPLALLRNGFRVFIVGELCVHIGPDMINSYIHRHGGPIFFTLSLIPFFLLLFGLIKVERSRAAIK